MPKKVSEEIKLMFVPSTKGGKISYAVLIAFVIFASFVKIYKYEGGASVGFAGAVIQVFSSIGGWVFIITLVRCPLVLFGVIKSTKTTL